MRFPTRDYPRNTGGPRLTKRLIGPTLCSYSVWKISNFRRRAYSATIPEDRVVVE